MATVGLRKVLQSIVVATVYLSGVSVAFADVPQEVCHAVFKNRAYNLYEETSERRFVSSVFTNFCEDLSFTESDIRGRATSLGVDYKSMSESLGLNYGDASSSARFVQNVRQMCDTKDSRLFEQSAFAKRQQITDLAVQAWSSCIKEFSDSLSAISEVQARADTLSISWFNGTARPADLKILDVTNGVRCSIAGRDALNSQPGQLGFGRAFGLTCTNPKGDEREFFINTNQNAATTFLFRFSGKSLLSAAEQRFADLENRIQIAKRELTEKLSQRLPHGTIAYFQQSDCPAPWQRFALLDGRYAVGSLEGGRTHNLQPVGIALGINENRATGRHTHHVWNNVDVNRPPYYIATQAEDRSGKPRPGEMGVGEKGQRWGDQSGPPNYSPADVPPQHIMTDGTNAPYLVLTACTLPRP